MIRCAASCIGSFAVIRRETHIYGSEMQMGHTVVTRFDQEGYEKIHNLMKNKNANKIPFGRNCDRVLVNEILDYHITMVHWGKEQDAYYLDKLSDFEFIPCQVTITGMSMFAAEEGSTLLYFDVIPGEGFVRMRNNLEQALQTYCSGFLHMPLAVSKDRGEILKIRKQLENEVTFPFTLHVEGLDLYHIWKPVKKVSFPEK